MRLWHNTEDAPRLPHRVFEGERVEVWVASYPIGPWHHVMIDWKVMHKSGTMESGCAPAFWKCHEFGITCNLWLAHLGPFLEGDRVEYAIAGMTCDEDLAPQIFTFNIEEKENNDHVERPGMRNESRRKYSGSYEHV